MTQVFSGELRGSAQVHQSGRSLPRELSETETQEVNGGLAPALAFVGAYIGHVGILGATGGSISMGVGFAAHVVSGVGLGYAAYSLGTAYGGGRFTRLGNKGR